MIVNTSQSFEDQLILTQPTVNQDTILEIQRGLDMRRLEGQYRSRFLDASDRSQYSMIDNCMPIVENHESSNACTPTYSTSFQPLERQNSGRLGIWSSANYEPHSEREDTALTDTTSFSLMLPTSNHSDGQGSYNPDVLMSGFQLTEPSTSELEEVVQVSEEHCQTVKTTSKRTKTYKKISPDQKREVYSFCEKNGLKATYKQYQELDKRTIKRICQQGPGRKVGSGKTCKEGMQDYEREKLFPMMKAIMKKYNVKEANETVLNLADLLIHQELRDTSGGWRQTRVKHFKQVRVIKKRVKINEPFLETDKSAKKLATKLLKL